MVCRTNEAMCEERTDNLSTVTKKFKEMICAYDMKCYRMQITEQRQQCKRKMFIKQCDKVHKSTQERSTPLRWIQNILNASYDFFLRKNKNYKNKHERLFQLKHNCANNPKRKSRTQMLCVWAAKYHFGSDSTDEYQRNILTSAHIHAIASHQIDVHR